MTDKELMQQALEALEQVAEYFNADSTEAKTIIALRKRLVQPDPSAYWHNEFLKHNTTSEQPAQQQEVDWEKLYRLEVKKKEALAAKYERDTGKKLTRIVPMAEQPEQQEQGDSNCQDDDGCPTEMAVLQRFWRGEPIPTEHYPAWFRPAQQQEPLLQEIARLHDRIKDLEMDVEFLLRPASKPWMGLTREDKVEILRANGEAAVLILTESKLREKNA